MSYILKSDTQEKQFHLTERRNLAIQSVSMLDMLYICCDGSENMYFLDATSVYKVEFPLWDKVETILE